ncbi:MAG: hypothetical protein QNK05_13415 [Myxococcota bacterium]|nr:hypothetical protein [Myxococcota bacterium]
MSKGSVLLCASVLLTVACATTYRDRYVEAFPGWSPSSWPGEGSSVEETLAAIAEPGSGTTSGSVLGLVVFRIEGESAQPLDPADLPPDGSATDGAPHAVVGEIECRSKRDLIRRYETRRVWYLHVDGRLVSYDHFTCGSSRFARGAPSFAELEARVQSLVANRFRHPWYYASSCPSLEYFGRGEAYLAVGRPAEAASMLAMADRFLTLDEDGSVRSASPIEWCRDPVDAGRRKLIDGIAREVRPSA